ncbi:MAG: 3'(2'),5'-bisphosphate nucleotidase [Candidatus Omnitrophica bacterium]|nr:3'(2'),5'-bisphosphate nucleotidase [Candidatus Omnitrophota bacterium]
MLDIANPQIRFAIEAVTQAGKLASGIQLSKNAEALSKSDASPVTLADFSVQALIASLLQKYFPADLLVAEESSSLLRSAEGQNLLVPITKLLSPFLGNSISGAQICDWIDRGCANPAPHFWTLDPIDGTKGFLRGGQYVIALALIENGQVKLGMLGCPNLSQEGTANIGGEGVMMIAQKNKGAWYASLKSPQNFQRLQVSNCKDTKQARLIQTFESQHTDVALMKKIIAGLGLQIPPIVMDSQVKHAVLARGAGDLLFYLNAPENPSGPIKIWDQAAGALIVEEAGGRVTDLRGKKLDFGCGKTLSANEGALLTNGFLHDGVLQVLKTLR